MSEKPFGIRIVAVHSDLGDEFKNPALQVICTKRGIMSHLTASYTPMNNGTVERASRTIADAVRAVLTNQALG